MDRDHHLYNIPIYLCRRSNPDKVYEESELQDNPAYGTASAPTANEKDDETYMYMKLAFSNFLTERNFCVAKLDYIIVSLLIG